MFYRRINRDIKSDVGQPPMIVPVAMLDLEL
jgi:hypothetical protein